MRGIVSFDIDMTLLDHKDFKIPDSALRAIEQLRKNYYIVIATGRDLDTKYSAGLREQILPDAVIHLNGTKITVGDNLIYGHIMNKELVRRILTFSQGMPFAVGISVGDEDYYINQEYVIRHDMNRWKMSERNFCDPWKLLEMDVRTMAYLGDEAGVALLEKEFPELKLPLFSSRQGADMIEKEASKAEGLKRLCTYYQIPLECTVAFGDSMNDYEIIRQAGIGVAMGNAMDDLKQAADYVTTPIGEDGIWNACVQLKLME